MFTFETLGGTVSITDEQVVLSESIPRRLWNHFRTDKRAQFALLVLVLLEASVFIYAPKSIGFTFKIIGGGIAIYTVLALYLRLKNGPQSRKIATDDISNVYLRTSIFYPPRIVLVYRSSNDTETRKPIVLQNKWQDNQTEPNEILTVLQDAGVTVESC